MRRRSCCRFRHHVRRHFPVLGLLLIVLCLAQPAWALDLRMTEVYSGLQSPIYLTHAGDGSGRVFVVQQQGKILVGRNGVLKPEPFLNLEGSVSGDSEQGLLGLAFAPDFAQSGRFYVNYTNLAGSTEIARYRISSSNPDRADPASKQVLLAYLQPFPNHNGGWLGFGPDGFLYIASGDGGSGGDPQNHAQRLDTHLGKMLRIDVAGATASIPPDNPFRSTSGAMGEIWAYGLRNPWRPSFDRQTGELWIADVGQARSEEVNIQPAGVAGSNYGWRQLEGSQCFASGCSPTGTVLPVSEYGRNSGCSITGGYVYRGQRYPAMQGRYFFGDFCSGRVFSLRRTGGGFSASDFSRDDVLSSGQSISSFGEDEEGNLYLVGYGGSIFLLSDGAPSSGPLIDRSFTGTWYDPAQSGHGLFLEVLDEGQLVAYWFTFDPNGQQAWFGGVGAIVGNRASVNLVKTQGGRFIPDFNPANVTFPAFGTLTLSFDSCRSGRVDFNLPDGFGQGSMVLQRLTEPLGNECAAPAQQ